MGKIDVVQMDFLRNPRHFADIWNGLVFDGKQVVKPDELSEISPVGLANSGEMNLKKTADMAMCRTVDGKILAVMITENQKEVDYSLPVRVRLREFMEYDKQVAEISRSLKQLARELKIPVIVLAQVKREVKEDKPSLSDLRESGSIEQDADLVLFLHDSKKKDDNGDQDVSAGKEVDIIIAKNRNGPIGEVKLMFLPAYTRFEPISKEHQ
jgi:replicative DNA helicase